MTSDLVHNACSIVCCARRTRFERSAAPTSIPHLWPQRTNGCNPLGRAPSGLGMLKVARSPSPADMSSLAFNDGHGVTSYSARRPGLQLQTVTNTNGNASSTKSTSLTNASHLRYDTREESPAADSPPSPADDLSNFKAELSTALKRKLSDEISELDATEKQV